MRAANVVSWASKELWSLAPRTPILLLLIAFVFTVSVYAGARWLPEIAGTTSPDCESVDETTFELSERIIECVRAALSSSTSAD